MQKTEVPKIAPGFCEFYQKFREESEMIYNSKQVVRDLSEKIDRRAERKSQKINDGAYKHRLVFKSKSQNLYFAENKLGDRASAC